MAVFTKDNRLLLRKLDKNEWWMPKEYRPYGIGYSSENINYSLLDIVKNNYKVALSTETELQLKLEELINTIYGCLYNFNMPNELIDIILDYCNINDYITHELYEYKLSIYAVSFHPTFDVICNDNKLLENETIIKYVENLYTPEFLSHIGNNYIEDSISYNDLFNNNYNNIGVTIVMYYVPTNCSFHNKVYYLKVSVN